MTDPSLGDYIIAIDKTNSAIYIQWKDNSVVAVASTVFGVSPTKVVTRYSKAERKKVSITCPYVISKYNQNMGGTDLMDEFINQYRINVRSKKWWWPIFTYWMLI